MVETNHVRARRSRPEGQQEDEDETTLPLKLIFIIAAASALIVGIYIGLARNLSEKLNKYSFDAKHMRDVLVVADNLEAGYLDHVVDAFEKHQHELFFKSSAINVQSYHIIWSHNYPFQSIKKLRATQRVNHFPGIGFVTSKSTLSTTPEIPNLLQAFRLPDDKEKFLELADKDRNVEEKLWVQKSSSHRGISVKKTSEVDLDLNDTLVQKFMSNPLLIDGKKFDIGIYAVITSVNPLRLYMYDDETLIRFCAHQYLNPTTKTFNASDFESYVVGDDYTPIWLMPSLLKHYIGTNLSMKQTLINYLESKLNRDPKVIWQQIEKTIKLVVTKKEDQISKLTTLLQSANNYHSTSVRGSLNQFFEMVRFDFIVDENLRVYLMEANMSPNLSSRHFPPNKLIYEQVLNSYFSLVGLTSFSKKHLYNLPFEFLDVMINEPNTNLVNGLDWIISDKQLSVYPELCSSEECHMNCHNPDCKVCYFCLNQHDKLHIRRAIYEHNNRWNFKRLLPSTKDEDLAMQQTRNQDTAESNHIHVQWFRGKCHLDSNYCTH